MQGIAIAMPCTIPSGHPQLMALRQHGPRIVMPAPIFYVKGDMTLQYVAKQDAIDLQDIHADLQP